jgi:hypothetical protein
MCGAFSDRVRVAASRQRSIETPTLAGVALAAVILAPSGAAAQCTRPIRSRREPSGWLRASFLASALAASLLVPSAAQAGCTDTFKYFFKPDPILPPFSEVEPFKSNLFFTPGGMPLQHAVPLGVGASLNALMATMNTVNTTFLSPSSSFITAPGGAERNKFGGGVWGRAVAGEVETKSSTTLAIDTLSAALVTINPQTGNARRFISGGFEQFITDGDEIKNGRSTCEGSLKEQYSGYQFGYDLAVLNLGGEGANIHFGVTAGYFGSKTKDTTPGSIFHKPLDGGGAVDLTVPEGTLGASTQVPFLGLYAALTAGNFFADGLVRQDFYLMNLTDPANGLKSEKSNAYGFSVAANAGYKIQLPFNWFIEPSGGALWSWVRPDPIDSPGAYLGLTTLPAVPGIGQGTGVPEESFLIRNAGRVQVDTIESVLGRATLRVGTTVNVGDVVWQPFAAGTVFHEFAKDVKATSTLSGDNIVVIGTNCSTNNGSNCQAFGVTQASTSTSRIGTFYQYGIGTAVVFGNSGWVGFGRGDYRTGENVEGYSVTGGIRYHW